MGHLQSMQGTGGGVGGGGPQGDYAVMLTTASYCIAEYLVVPVRTEILPVNFPLRVWFLFLGDERCAETVCISHSSKYCFE